MNSRRVVASFLIVQAPPLEDVLLRLGITNSIFESQRPRRTSAAIAVHGERDGRQDQHVLRCRHATWIASHRLTQREAD